MGTAKPSHHGQHPRGESIEDMSRLVSIRVVLLIVLFAAIPAPGHAADLTAGGRLGSAGKTTSESPAS